jgi:hypothetical protein
MTAAYDPETLCLALLHADAEAEVVDILVKAGLWYDAELWRDLGDEPENYSTVGNQQSRAEQALVEKLVNAVDTKLIAASVAAGVDPAGPEAPTTMREARERFFGEQLKDLNALSRSITVAATGAKSPKHMSLSIADDGEGQTPLAMPRTILSVMKGSKKLIPFVQGRFHMGGTGVLEFCGVEHNLQLVISRRNPLLRLNPAEDPSDNDWSFTVVRRNDPQPGSPKGSNYVYLAPGPFDSDGRRTLVHFSAAALRMLPDKNEAYARDAAWGTLFKLYEYELRLKSNILLDDGLMRRVRLMLPEPALPIRWHECRAFRGHTGSFDTTMKGVIPTLDDDRRNPKRDNVEWFDRFSLDVDGETFDGRIYLFKNSKAADVYRRDEGIVFTLNGQMHATLSKDFFRRQSVKQDYLWNTLLVFVDCTAISVRAREMLFMPSRDRLRDRGFRRTLEEALEDKLKNHPKLKEIASARRDRERAEAPQVTESFKRFLEEMLKRHPQLAGLLGPGLQIKNPHKPLSVVPNSAQLTLHRFPTYFRFKNVAAGETYKRDAHLNSQVRLTLETDAEDDYFSRDDQAGSFKLRMLDAGEWVAAKNWKSPNLAGGEAHISLALPADSSVGSVVEYEVTVTDPSRVEPFVSRLALTVKPERVAPSGPTVTPLPRKQPTPKPGDGATNDSTLAIPEPHEVEEAKWPDHEGFDKHTALVIKAAPDAPEGQVVYDYYVNMANVHLASAMRTTPKKAADMRRQFKLGMTIIALSLVQDDMTRASRERTREFDPDAPAPLAVTDQVKMVSSAMAPFLIPMVAMLAMDAVDDEPLSATAGEAA